jgi:dipicolinate synthase subunit B
MGLSGVKIGFAITGSHCSFDEVMPQINRLVEAGAEVCPVMSGAAFNTDTRFGSKEKWRQRPIYAIDARWYWPFPPTMG